MEMGSNQEKNTLILVTDPPKVDEKFFRGSAMTKHVAYAAISYTSCAGS
ncbi:hypothetical protein BVRB_5g124930 [Beta vulgaris subsp. vulgaris]|uniref:Uncharacterized protein n=1 Tax=Beta vulgaris subsp. vulgaris TaxID=3555 RepID=A0A0J8BC71_BETVV|nr:hypothetical protein BVRB_5g124930 [Beta vulgaris subsp. vulgaris]